MALLFDGSTEFANIGDFLDYERTDAFSACLWHYWVSGTGGGYISKALSAPPRTGWDFREASNKAIVNITNNSAGDEIGVRLNAAYTTGQWNHLGFSYDGSSDESGLLMYVNGANVAKSVDVNALTLSILNNENVRFARRNEGTYLNARIFDLRVYKRELSAAEFKIIYESRGNDGITTNLEVRLRMDENADGVSANSMIDLSTSGLTVTTTNTPQYKAFEGRIG
jgi:hypothetical protein